MRLELRPEGDVRRTLDVLAEGLPRLLPVSVVRGDPESLPNEAYQRARDRYRASLIVDRLPLPAEGLILAVTDKDLYAGDLPVFGLADPATGRGVFSSRRLSRDPARGEPPSAALFERRVLTEAGHLVGRLLGLEKCEREECLMHFSFSLFVTDRKRPELCEACRQALEELRTS